MNPSAPVTRTRDFMRGGLSSTQRDDRNRARTGPRRAPELANGVPQPSRERVRECTRYSLDVPIFQLWMEWEGQLATREIFRIRKLEGREPIAVVGKLMDWRIVHRSLDARVAHPAHYGPPIPLPGPAHLSKPAPR